MSPSLTNKVALVTGGSRGIGAAIAEALVAAGARVAIASRKQDDLDATAAQIRARHPGATIVSRACHMGQPQAIAELVASVERELGTIDVAVNNAAANPYFGPLVNAEWPAWDKTFDVNVKGYFEVARQVSKRLLEAKKPGSIISVASVAGLRGSPMQGIYAMTKAAVISMTQTLAMELGRAGIRVNAIAPGLVETKFASTLVSNPDLAKFFTERSALGRHGQPEEIAPLVVYLASDASSFLTGQTIAIDGGFLAA